MAAVTCPKCGSLTSQAGFPAWVIIVAICFFPVGLLALLAGRKPTQCGNCSHRLAGLSAAAAGSWQTGEGDPMRIRQLILAFALVLGTAVAALAADVTGTWTAEFDTQIGVQKYVFTFKVDGEKLTGEAAAERMGEKSTVTLTGGTVKGDQIAFTEPLNFQGQDVPITYTGTVAGDEIKFTRKVGDFATEELVAKRKKD